MILLCILCKRYCLQQSVAKDITRNIYHIALLTSDCIYIYIISTNSIVQSQWIENAYNCIYMSLNMYMFTKPLFTVSGLFNK